MKKLAYESPEFKLCIVREDIITNSWIDDEVNSGFEVGGGDEEP